MSDDKISLDFLGEQMLRMQADLRGVRSEQVRLESEQTSMRADLRRVETKVDSLDVKVDRHAAAADARFEGANRTAATHFEILLKAFESIKR